MATNFPPSGSAATNSIWKPGGTVKAASSSSAVSGESLGGLAGSGAPTKGGPARTWRMDRRRIASETRELARLVTASGAPTSGPAPRHGLAPETPGRRPALLRLVPSLVAGSRCAPRELAQKNSLPIRRFEERFAGEIIPSPISLRWEFANFDVPEPALIVVIGEENMALDFLAEAG